MRKDIFIINPAAGKRDRSAELAALIKGVAESHGLTYQIYITEYKGHAIQIVEREAGTNDSDLCRFYACGGDGTLNEVVCGAAGHGNVQVACYPCGTGNDFIKIFEGQEQFLDMDALIEADAVPLDLIQMNNKFAINLCSAGIDARVADWVGRYNHKIPLPGKLMYDLSLVVNFFGRIHRYYEVELDGECLDGEYSIIVAASGRYYGGGFYAIPEAEPDDGLLDFLLIRKVGHLDLLRFIGKYQAGLHNELGEFQVYQRGRKLVLRSRNPEPCNYDGEILRTKETVIQLAPWKLSVVMPKGSCIARSQKEKLRYSEKTGIRNSK